MFLKVFGKISVLDFFEFWGRIFSHVRPFCERAVSDPDP